MVFSKRQLSTLEVPLAKGVVRTMVSGIAAKSLFPVRLRRACCVPVLSKMNAREIKPIDAVDLMRRRWFSRNLWFFHGHCFSRRISQNASRRIAKLNLESVQGFV